MTAREPVQLDGAPPAKKHAPSEDDGDVEAAGRATPSEGSAGPDVVHARTAVEAALAYASIDWFVFPVHWLSDGRCSCGDADCRRPGKHPCYDAATLPHGFRSATTDEALIRAWWRRWPLAQIGVDCGRSRILVIDLDVDASKGFDGVEQFELLRGLNPSGYDLAAVTPRGGRQLFFRMPDGAPITCSTGTEREGVAPGIDVKGEGGYVILPGPNSPKRHWSVGEWAAEVALSPPLPWLAEVLTPWRKGASATKGGPEPTFTMPQSERDRCETSSALFAIPSSVGRPTWLAAIRAVHARLDAATWGAELVEYWSSTTTVDGQYRPGEASKIYAGSTLPHLMSEPGIDRGTLFATARGYGWRAAGVARRWRPD